MTTAKVVNISETFEKIDVDKLKKECPDSQLLTFPLQKVHCHVEIENIQPEFASALLRSAVAEQEHYALDVNYTSVYRTDKDINIPYMISIIKLIPLRIGLSDNEIESLNMYLDVTNNTENTIIVRSGNISFRGNTKPTFPLFQPTIELTNLEPGCRLKIDNIKIVRGVSFQSSIFLLGTNGRIWPIKENHYTIDFKLNSVQPNTTNITRNILLTGIINLIDRLNYIKEIIDEDNKIIMKVYETHIELNFVETNTIAKLIDRACCMYYPSVSNISSLLTYHSGKVNITVVGRDAKKILRDTVERCVAFYQDLSIQISEGKHR